MSADTIASFLFFGSMAQDTPKQNLQSLFDENPNAAPIDIDSYINDGQSPAAMPPGVAPKSSDGFILLQEHEIKASPKEEKNEAGKKRLKTPMPITLTLFKTRAVKKALKITKRLKRSRRKKIMKIYHHATSTHRVHSQTVEHPKKKRQ